MRFVSVSCVALLVASIAACVDEGLSPLEVAKLEELGPLGARPASPSNAVADDERAVALGQGLFFDPELSKVGSGIACVDCHQPKLGWADDLQYSSTATGTTIRHAQTLTNVAYNQFMFWDGRGDSLWAQAYVVTIGVHAVDKTHLVEHLAQTPAYADLYTELFGALPDPAIADDMAIEQVAVNCGKVLEAYERTLVSKNSALDRWIAGDEDALTDQQLRGAKLFVGEGGCVECHSGPNLSDGWFHNIGLPAASDGRDASVGLNDLLTSANNAAGQWSDDPEWGAAQLDEIAARIDAAGDALIGAHKTPTLRDVVLRPRFGHDGRIKDLHTWIARYRDAKVDEGAVGTLDPEYVKRDLSDADIEDLIAFLHALTGDPSSADVGW
ncbi:cytochrome-c peroxidase [Nannocystaceae bacterium ST9]